MSTYADNVSGLVYGREHLMAMWKRVATGEPFNVYIAGDSTVAMDNQAFSAKSSDLVSKALQDSGINGHKVFNLGVSGTSWCDLDILSHLGEQTSVLFIKYGINDRVKLNPLATLIDDMDSKLSAIRSHVWGSLDKLSIVLMLPNSTYSPSTGQDSAWYEQLLPEYLIKAKKHSCVVLDTYAFMQDSENAPGFWMDVTSTANGKPQGIHPDPVASHSYWREAVKTFLFGGGGSNPLKANNLHNVTLYSKSALASDVPSAFELGISMLSATESHGFPYTGPLLVERFADGYVVQTVRTLDPAPRTATRTGSTVHNVWTQWCGVPIKFTPEQLSAGRWRNLGGGYREACYQVGEDGYLSVEWVLAGGNGVYSIVVNLPPEIRPDRAQIVPASNGGTVTFFPNGDVVAAGVNSSQFGLSCRVRIKD